jgi:hypothetical protein
MNILEQEDLIKGLPDAALMQEASAPSGEVPQFLVISEIKRRSDMRKRFEQQQQPEGTVKDQIVMEAMGIGGVMPPQMASAPQPMGPAGAPPMGAMPPPMGGMPPQGMPPMALPMPQGGIASAPPAMPPMGMAQGGIVRMQKGGVLDMPTPAGSTVRQQIDEAIALGMPYADLLAFIADKFPGSPEVREYLVAKTQGEGAGMESVGGMTAGDREAVSEAAPMRMMPKLAGGSDLYKGPMVLRAADALGLFDAYKSKPEDDRMLEPAASALAQQVVDEYAVPDTGIRGIFASSASDDLGIASIGGGDARVQAAGGDIGSLPTEKDIAGARSAFMGRTIMPPVGDARTQAIESAEVQSGPALTSRQRVQEQRGGDPLFTDFSLETGRGTRRGLRELEQQALDDSQLRISRDNIPSILSDLTDYTTLTDKEGKLLFPAVAADEVAAQSPFSLEFLQRENAIAAAREKARNEDFSTFAGEDIYRTAGAGTETTKGERTPQTRLTDAVAELPRNDRSDPDMPALDFSDLIAESKQQALANAMIQLGAGVASGDISKGLAAAGTAAMEGTADARALDMKRRLAEYQAGREDIRRGDEASRYKEGMDLKREQFDTRLQFDMAKLDAEMDQSDEITRRSLITSIPDLIREANDEIGRLQQFGSDEAALERIADLQNRIESLYKQYEKYSTMPSRGENRFSGYSLVGQR